jgi:hypothetical protein
MDNKLETKKASKIVEINISHDEKTIDLYDQLNNKIPVVAVEEEVRFLFFNIFRFLKKNIFLFFQIQFFNSTTVL